MEYTDRHASFEQRRRIEIAATRERKCSFNARSPVIVPFNCARARKARGVFLPGRRHC